MFLIFGLGNPGLKYQKTRHNVGFRIIDQIKKGGDFSAFRFSKKAKADFCSGFFRGEKIILAKPQTFMNNSGRAAKVLISNLKFPAAACRPARQGRTGKIENFWVVHDDIDLPLGKIKIAKDRGAAGHKGVASIIKELKTKNFVRFRVGIKPQTSTDKKEQVNIFVLKKFNSKEESVLKEVIEKVCRAIEMALKEGPEKAMAKFNN